MAETVRAGGDGRITLPETMRSFFAEGEEVEVLQHPQHIALWKRWERRAPGHRPGDARGARKTVYAESAKRMFAAARLLRVPSPEVALYLSGYCLECRLKWLVCEEHGFPYLDEAEEQIARTLGTEHRLTGGSGHDLELLFQLGACHGLLRERPFLEAWNRCARWSTGWRYAIPAGVRQEADAYLKAFELVYRRLGEVR